MVMIMPRSLAKLSYPGCLLLPWIIENSFQGGEVLVADSRFSCLHSHIGSENFKGLIRRLAGNRTVLASIWVAGFLVPRKGPQENCHPWDDNFG